MPDAQPLRDQSSRWGNKVTLHAYVKGGFVEAMNVSDALSDAVNAEGFPPTEFCGITIDPVIDQPNDQVAT